MLDAVYKKYFCLYVDKIINVKQYDDMIINSDLSFGVSTTLEDSFKDMFNTKYIRCLNNFYVDKLDENFRNIIMDDSIGEDGKFSVIKETFMDVLTKDNTKYIMYDFDMEDRIIENPCLVFEIVYGKNSVKLEGKEYIENSKKQRELIAYISKQLESVCFDALGLKCKVLFRREV